MEGMTQAEAAEAARLEAMTAAERERAGQVDTLTALTGLLAAHPEVPWPQSISRREVVIWFWGASARSDMAAAARAFRLCEWEKRPWESEERAWFDMAADWNGWRIVLTTSRDAVCRKVVTGTREVIEMVPDPEALAAIPMIEATRTEEIVTWECEPVMAPAGTDVAA